MLETVLSEALKLALSSLPLRLHISTQEWEDTEPLYNDPSIEKPAPKCRRRRRLIFVSQGQESPEVTEVTGATKTESQSPSEDKASPLPTKENHEVYILGLSVLEYETDKSAEDETKVVKTIYIDKLDSSGYGVFPERGSIVAEGRMTVARALIHGYLKYCENEYLCTNEEIFLHVFARSQPQYLFAESTKNAKKNILNDQELIHWWRKSLHSISTPKSLASEVKGYWYVPGLDDIIERSSAVNEDDMQFSWKWGWPYDNKDKALYVIPQFPDDAKSRLLAKDHMEDVTVWEFFELLSISEECGSGRRAGFFVLHMKSDESDHHTDDTEETISPEQFHEVSELLYYLDFSTYEECVKSTRRLNDLLTRIQVRCIEVVPDKLEILPKQESLKRKASPKVNTLSGSLIKKKPKTEVNVLGGSLVRKKPKTDSISRIEDQ